MKRNWELDELIEHFTILPNEMKLIENKTGETRIGFEVLFKFFQKKARFPTHKFEVPKAVIAYIAKQIFSDPELYTKYDWTGRSITYHRTQIREFFGFREDTLEDAQEMTEWLCQHVLYHDHDVEHLKEHVYSRFRELKIVPPPPRPYRTAHSVRHSHLRREFFPNHISKAAFLNLSQVRLLD